MSATVVTVALPLLGLLEVILGGHHGPCEGGAAIFATQKWPNWLYFYTGIVSEQSHVDNFT